jgi:hypothetical protein
MTPNGILSQYSQEWSRRNTSLIVKFLKIFLYLYLPMNEEQLWQKKWRLNTVSGTSEVKGKVIPVLN